MGQHLTIKTIRLTAIFAALLVMSASGSIPFHAEAHIAAAQTYPVISLDTPLARDAQTFESDKRLEAACRKTGQDKSVCLCVTHILKYELTLSEYRAATRIYGQSGDRTALRRDLKEEGFATSDIDMAEQMEQSLINDGDFALRCSEAKAYYKTKG